MKVLLSFGIILLVGLAQSATIVRNARNTEGIIPSIVEEILKVELQSDLKKNSEVVDEVVVEVKKIPEQPKVEEPAAAVVVTDEKITTFEGDMEKIVEVKKIETIEKPKEEVQPEPIVRNVVKEEIPQVEELRNVPVVPVAPVVPVVPVVEVIKDTPAVQESIPEPVVASFSAQPEFQVEQKLKTDIPAEKVVIVDVVVPAEVKKIPEVVVEDIPKTEHIEKIEEKVVVVETVVPEVKKVVEEPTDKVVEVVVGNEPVAPETKQNNRPILQQLTNAVGSLFNRTSSNTPAVAADEAVQDESSTTQANFIQQAIQNVQNFPQQALANVQSTVQNVVNSLAPANTNNAENGETPPRVPLFQQAVQAIQNVPNAIQSTFTNLQNSILPQTVNTASTDKTPATTSAETTSTQKKEDEEQKPEDEAAKSTVAEVVPIKHAEDFVVLDGPQKEKEIIPAEKITIVEEKKTDEQPAVVA